MTGLRIAFLFVAVVTGDYAAFTLIDGQLSDFGVAATICAASSIAAGLIAYSDDEATRRLYEFGRQRRKVVASAPRERPDQQCGSCRGACQTPSESTRFADRHDPCDARAARAGAPRGGGVRPGMEVLP